MLKLKNREVLLDDDDYARFCRWKWEFSGGKVQRHTNFQGKRVHVILARLISACPKGMEVDHKNRNPLDNRKENLRICTRLQNEMNKPTRKESASGYKGVRMVKNSWVARIKIDGKFKHIGCFFSKEEAAKAYNEKAKELYGEFAWLNPV